MTAEQEAVETARALASKKAEDVKIYDVRGISGLTDYYVAATGSAAPHLKALAAEVQDSARAAGIAPGRVCGEPDSGWIVIDRLDVVVHVFSPEARAYYALEKLWADARQVAF